MSNYGREISSIYLKTMLGTQRNVIADTSLDNNGVPVLAYNRTKTKSNDQVPKTLSAQHLCGPGGKSRAKTAEIEVASPFLEDAHIQIIYATISTRMVQDNQNQQGNKGQGVHVGVAKTDVN